MGISSSRRRRIILPSLAIVAAATIGLAGCSSSGSTGQANAGSTPTVTVWSWRSQDVPIWKTVQKELAKEGTNVTIKFRSISPTSYDSILQTAMNGGAGPNIFYDRSTQTYAAAKFVKPLDGIADTSNINPSALAGAQYKGKTYGVPFAVQTMGLFYNKDILKENNIAVPKSWSGLLSAMKKLKGKGVTPMYVMGVQQWLLALQIDAIGASTMSNATTKSITDKKSDYTHPQYVQTLAAFQQLAPYLEDNWQATGSGGNEQETAFALGKTAFMIDGIFNTVAVKQVAPTLNYGQMLVPSPNGGTPKIDWYVDGAISMNANISDKATERAAEKVVAFTGTKAFGNAFSDIAGEISPIKGVKVPAKYPLSFQAAKWFNTVPLTPIFGIRSPMDTPDPDPTSLKNKTSAAKTPGIFKAEQDVAGPLLEGKMTPAEAAAKVQSTLGWYFGGK